MEPEPSPTPATPFSAFVSPIRRLIKASGLARAWELLTLHDHWQGEACVASVGALGWAAISFFAPEDVIDAHTYRVLNGVASEEAVQAWMVFFGLLQLYGLRYSYSFARAFGALGVLMAFVCVAYSLAAVNPWTLGLSIYGTVIMIEFFAVVYQTASIVRYQEGPAWLWKTFSR